MTGAARLRRSSRLLVVAALAAVVALIGTACSDGHHDVRQNAPYGWPMYGGNAANANFTYSQVPDDLQLIWNRDVGGAITAPLAINGSGDVAGVAKTASGCNLNVFDQRAGRKNYCKRLGDGSPLSTPLFDQIGQPYVGEAGMFFAFNGGGAIRWRYPTYGVPLSAKFAAPGRVLVATTQGQVLLLNAQTGDLAAPEALLRPDTNVDPTVGLADCTVGGPACAIAAPPALDLGAGRAFLTVFPKGARSSQVKAMTYTDGAITDLWSADIGGGVMGPPTLSADGKTVYSFGRDGKLYALDAATGTVRWSHDVGGHGFATLSVSPDGILVPAGALGGPLTILRDKGSSVEVVAQRDDVQTAGLGTQTSAGTVWAVARDGESLALTEFSTADGATKRTLPLPGAKGFSTGVAVSAWGSIAVGTSNGTVFFFYRPF
ncbi:PQQ-binding-like beta-propeller repeat protein [Gordonia sp. PDNC005]|uniref:outer membrane protein assembly factor BamB family protein n=1 Tax=unclassified Gordonia (in: high G+C Gram-positive bacteria) TaxID=2657482 RepID=UPI001964101D|nr:PQQ-binding-like beta-propeller repeat protein [Gordonia sp. PDNC005]QRY61144.1 PQQ-binding-like beta-propeller repeat protein [Gordonia sp. PDNC005]